LAADINAIDWAKVEQAKNIGLSAGASAPEKLVREVIQEIKDRYDVTLSEDAIAKENITFKLPSILSA